ncbi:MAG: amino acid ABC transporter permease [Erysipelotrichaceae bacterium]|jgi:cystine transport system permease protein|nr:amino acid ABC transporter permease [Erysipelotrichaceae bacterium]MBQ1300031.1 amino acid ABC transporter permease [Erysipelotrichaceae bacterium]MBQ1303985.1 amino acid ABC transporter permease [Erysipelotrichaceae bacterium]MBQ2214612.1 amino acid ABC transporter permease [Erysipelotrichaceae bacterium]MBQ2685746.1 amino acid ABC transporter permease [Erysipelotrichaceae bacterium]
MDSRIIKILVDSFGSLLLAGFKMTIPLTVISFSIGLVIALFTALVQTAKVPVLRKLARFYVWIIRGTPMIVQLFVVYFGLPNIGILLSAFASAVLVFSVSVGAYCSETVRAAIESVPVGQMEAGYCVGMNYWQIMYRIVIPQALRTAFPPLSNSLIGLVKDTSLAYSISIVEIMATAQRIATRTYDYFLLYIEAAFVYLIFCTVLQWLQRYLEGKLAQKR